MITITRTQFEADSAVRKAEWDAKVKALITTAISEGADDIDLVIAKIEAGFREFYKPATDAHHFNQIRYGQGYVVIEDSQSPNAGEGGRE